MKSIKVGFRGRKINIPARRLSFLGQFWGLMFRTRRCENLIFDYPGRWGIHSWFVFFSFLAVWVDKNNRVIEVKVVRPFTFYVEPKREFARLIELPINKANKKIFKKFHG